MTLRWLPIRFSLAKMTLTIAVKRDFWHFAPSSSIEAISKATNFEEIELGEQKQL